MVRGRMAALPTAILALSAVWPGGAPSPSAQTAGRSPASGPSARANMGMATEPIGGAVLFGGLFIDDQGNVQFFGDTWVLPVSVWTEHHPAHSPSARAWPMMVFDFARGETVLFGGADGTSVLSDTWTWDGYDWTERHPATHPPGMCCDGMAYDAATRKTVLFGEGGTWTWDGSSWTEEHPPNSPRARFTPGMAGSVRHVVLFGGDSCLDICYYPRDTWSWDGTTWSRRRVAMAPHPRAGPAIVENPSSQLTVLFGGSNENTPPYVFGDTWVWGGGAWTKQDPPVSPPARAGATLAYQPSYHFLMLFGGMGASGYLADTWAWDGRTWHCVDGCT